MHFRRLLQASTYYRKSILVASVPIILLLSVSAIANVTANTESNAAWKQQMQFINPPGIGCYTVNYPSTTWIETACSPPPTNMTFEEGGTYNSVLGDSSSANVGTAVGGVTSLSGYYSETDTCGVGCGKGSNYYSLQENTNYFATNLDGGTQAWFQFVWKNTASSGSGTGDVLMELWLNAYYYDNGYCPSGSPGTDINNWQVVDDGPGGIGYDCTALTWQSATLEEDPANLASITLEGTVYGGTDTTAEFCDTTSCQSMSVSDILGLHGNWEDIDWNVYGYGGGTQAAFYGYGTSGTDMTIRVDTWDTSGNQLSPGDYVAAPYTGESNNLNYYGESTGTGYYQFLSCETTPC